MVNNYPSEILGVRLFARRDSLADGDVSYDFQTTSAFNDESAGQLLSSLPEDLQICYADPDRGTTPDLTYVFIRRRDDKFFEMIGGHGWTSSWISVPLQNILSSFTSSRLVRSPLEDFESFTIQNIPKHQRDEHLA